MADFSRALASEVFISLGKLFHKAMAVVTLRGQDEVTLRWVNLLACRGQHFTGGVVNQEPTSK